MWVLAAVVACSQGDAYIVEGTVVEVRGRYEVVVDHEAIEGLMGAMTMPFEVRDPAVIEGLKPGDRIVARLIIDAKGSYLERVRVSGHGPPPKVAMPSGPAPLRPGQVLPKVDVPLATGGAWTVGEGQGIGTVVTFLYTRCPLPEFCPATVSRLQALQAKVGTDARLLAVTLDPAHDTPEVLVPFAAAAGADTRTWAFGWLEGDALADLAMHAGLTFTADGGEIVHSIRWLVLDRDGRVVERYDDNRFPVDRMVEQLRTGGPPAPPGSDGTVTPEGP